MTKVNISDRMSHFIVEAEDISEEDFEALSQASNHSQFKFEEDLEYNYEDDSDYLPSSQDSSSQEFSQVRRDEDYDDSDITLHFGLVGLLIVSCLLLFNGFIGLLDFLSWVGLVVLVWLVCLFGWHGWLVLVYLFIFGL